MTLDFGGDTAEFSCDTTSDADSVGLFLDDEFL